MSTKRKTMCDPKVLALAASMAIAGANVAQAKEDREQVELPEAVGEFIGETAQVKRSWKVNDNLIAILLETGQGQGMTVFMDASGQYLLSGAMIDLETKENVAETWTKEAFDTKEETGAAEMYKTAESTAWVATGKAQRGVEPIYVVVDTQCGHCHRLAHQVDALGVEREIRWIPVGYLGPRSSMQAAAVVEMEAQSGAAVLWALLTGQADGVPGEVSEEAAKRVAQNEKWAQRWGVKGTPALVLKHKGQARQVMGLPQTSFWKIIGDHES